MAHLIFDLMNPQGEAMGKNALNWGMNNRRENFIAMYKVSCKSINQTVPPPRKQIEEKKFILCPIPPKRQRSCARIA